jgi:transposase
VSDLELSAPIERPIRRRTRRDPQPRFKPDTTAQLDGIRGCPSLQVPEKHLARSVLGIVERFDLSAIEATYSSLGRHGYRPRSVLAVWIYASFIGLHHATKVARALMTDAALRFLSGGYAISRSKLNEFRQQNGALFAELIEQTVSLAQRDGLLPVEDLAADSMRLRAHASTKAVRSLSRSTRRLKELAAIDQAKLSDEERAKHQAKVEKHTQAVADCEARNRTSIVTTNPSAVLMKFPDGAGAAGHRVSLMAAGVQARFVVAVLVTADVNDYGLLEPVAEATRKTLLRIGSSHDVKLQAAADAGYTSKADLAYAERVRDQIDILINGTDTPHSHSRDHFGRERFVFRDDGSVICPAGRPMKGPHHYSDGDTVWRGVGCAECPMRTDCTSGKRRSLFVNAEFDRLRHAMQSRMSVPGATERYNRRIATIEPVFSNIESVMGFRRASSRFETTVVAEVLLKVLAHNISRLLAKRSLRVIYLSLSEFPATL